MTGLSGPFQARRLTWSWVKVTRSGSGVWPTPTSGRGASPPGTTPGPQATPPTEQILPTYHGPDDPVACAGGCTYWPTRRTTSPSSPSPSNRPVPL